MNCAIELNQQKKRLYRFVRESHAGHLTLLNGSLLNKQSNRAEIRFVRLRQMRHEMEVLERQVHEMESTICHPESLSWLRQTLCTLQEKQQEAECEENAIRLIK